MKKAFSSVALVATSMSAAIAGTTTVPKDLDSKLFASSKFNPSPACICAAPTGEVFVGVDKQGSLGKKVGYGEIVRLVDTDNDGKADKKTVFAKVNNPRGLISIGDKLYCLHTIVAEDGKIDTQQLSVYTDADNDGVADGAPKPILKNIGNPKFVRSRGADHCTNGIRLAIDGWIYISVGDFGFIDAVGSDGKKLSMLGGGIVRIRPDGSEVETFIHGTRNVYDVAIDPFMNVFSRENTNDGIGWWVRFSHYIQTGEYGYPSLYTNFPEDMIPALGEFGSGSGTGALFLNEPGWPAKYNNMPLMADWGKSHIFIHRPVTDGASFTQTQERFIQSSQIADLDVDGSGRMYLAAWDGAGYSGNAKRGFVSVVTPKGWTYKPFPNLAKLNEKELVALIDSPSFTTRIYAQQEILRRGGKSFDAGLLSLAENKKASAEGRVAAVYTIAQLAPSNQTILKKLAADELLREHAIREMADRISTAKEADLQFLIAALKDKNPRVQVAAAVALGRVGDKAAANALISQATPVHSDTVTAQKIKSVKSKLVKGSDSAQIDVDISSYGQLVLNVNAEGNNGRDHAAWIDPTIIMEDGSKLDLTTVKWVKATQGWGQTRVNQDCVGQPFKNNMKGFGTHAVSSIVYKIPKGAKRFTAKGLLTNTAGSVSFSVASGVVVPSKAHSTPNSPAILPHIARQALVSLDATDACIKALNSADIKQQRAALAVMKFMHSENVVAALIAKAKTEKNASIKQLAIQTLIRLHQKEVEYDGSTWWNTRPEPHGPYFYPVDWEGTAAISSFITELSASLNATDKAALVKSLKKNRAYVPVLNPRPAGKGPVVKTVGKTSIENTILYLNSHKANLKKGSKIITKVGCAGCHNIAVGQPVKAPDLTLLGGLKKDIVAEAILKPSASIAKSWVTVTMNDGSSHLGTLTKKDAKQVVVNNMGGIATTLDATKVKSIKPGLDMMSHHLCDSLTLQEFTDLVGYIQSMDKRKPKKQELKKKLK